MEEDKAIILEGVNRIYYDIKGEKDFKDVRKMEFSKGCTANGKKYSLLLLVTVETIDK